MVSRGCAGRRLAAASVLGLGVLGFGVLGLAVLAPPAVAGSPNEALDLPVVLELIRSDVAAAEAMSLTEANSDTLGRPALRIEGVSAEIDLVDLGGGRFGVATPRFYVQREKAAAKAAAKTAPSDTAAAAKAPAAPSEAATAANEAADDRPVLGFRRRALVEWALAKQAKPEGNANPGALAKALNEARAAARAASGGASGVDIKRLSLDLAFAVDRDNKGQAILVVAGSDRKGDPRALNKLKVRFAPPGDK
jgi:hypothetical protein